MGMGICEQCKINEGTHFFRSIIGNTGRDLLVCEECLSKMTGGDAPVAFVNGRLVSDGKNRTSKIDQEVSGVMELRCEKCGTSLPDISQLGKFGCEECYVIFSDLLNIADCKITANKKREIEVEEAKQDVPKMFTQLDKLRAQMKSAIDGENYEEAAQLRDEIAKLNNKSGEEL